MEEKGLDKDLRKTGKQKLIFWIISVSLLVVVLLGSARFISKKTNFIGNTKKLFRTIYLACKMNDDERDKIINWKAVHKEAAQNSVSLNISKTEAFNTSLTEGHRAKIKYAKVKEPSMQSPLKLEGWKAISLFLSFNIGPTEGHSNKAIYFNGKSSYIKTPMNFNGCKAITISFWVKPQRKDNNELSVILDNGHDVKNNFAIQSADIKNPNNGIWAFHCNGIDILLTLPFNEWTQVVVSADAEKGIIQAYANGIKVGEEKTASFKFGSTPLTIGRLSRSDERYFKGSIDEIEIFDKVFPPLEKG